MLGAAVIAANLVLGALLLARLHDVRRVRRALDAQSAELDGAIALSRRSIAQLRGDLAELRAEVGADQPAAGRPPTSVTVH
jgi:hypothetical protein